MTELTEVTIATLGALMLTWLGSEIIVAAAIANHMPPGLWVAVAIIGMIGAGAVAPSYAPKVDA